jgi:hypothetical protein
LRREAEALPLKASILPWVTTILVVGRSLYCMTLQRCREFDITFFYKPGN